MSATVVSGETEAEAREGQAGDIYNFASFAYLLTPLILSLVDLALPESSSRPRRSLVLENHNILARAPKGSGKTATYCIPLVQKLLNAKAIGTFYGGTIFPSTTYSLIFCFISV